ncbi:MAG: prevent-host-death protein, partial [Deltaproteobacteria bacterium]|nr:prevent-host-death protein [Deltaproteobacteria bacterium]
EDRLDVEAADRVVAEMKATGERPITLDELKRQLGI